MTSKEYIDVRLVRLGRSGEPVLYCLKDVRKTSPGVGYKFDILLRHPKLVLGIIRKILCILVSVFCGSNFLIISNTDDKSCGIGVRPYLEGGRV